MNISKNGVGLFIIMVEFILTSLGIEFEVGTVSRAVEGVFLTVSLLLMVWNQIDRSDVSGFLFKK